jgi:AIG2 family protein
MEYKRLYLAYGSNINLEQMARRCPHSKVIGTAMIPDYELEFRGVATIVPKKGAEVPVLMWEIDQQDEINLNHYEGFPRLYRKEIFEMEVNGKIREGMAYLMNYKGIAPPTAQYYNGIKKGYEDNGMDTKYLHDALVRSVEYQQAELCESEESIEDEFQMSLE